MRILTCCALVSIQILWGYVVQVLLLRIRDRLVMLMRTVPQAMELPMLNATVAGTQTRQSTVIYSLVMMNGLM